MTKGGLKLDDVTRRRVERTLAGVFSEEMYEMGLQAAQAKYNYESILRDIASVIAERFSKLTEMQVPSIDVEDADAEEIEHAQRSTREMIYRIGTAMADDLVRHMYRRIVEEDGPTPCDHQVRAHADGAPADSIQMHCSIEDLYVARSGEALPDSPCFECGVPLYFRTWRPPEAESFPAAKFTHAGPWLNCTQCSRWADVSQPVEIGDDEE